MPQPVGVSAGVLVSGVPQPVAAGSVEAASVGSGVPHGVGGGVLVSGVPQPVGCAAAGGGVDSAWRHGGVDSATGSGSGGLTDSKVSVVDSLDPHVVGGGAADAIVSSRDVLISGTGAVSSGSPLPESDSE